MIIHTPNCRRRGSKISGESERANMAERVVKIPTADISKEVANFSIGLAKLVVHNRVEDASLAGTGTLVSVGKVDGMLTAAHVLDALPSKGEVGIILFKDSALQKHVIDMAHAVPVSIRGQQFDADGPDLGFLRLPQPIVGWLRAISSFYNLTKHRDEALVNTQPTPHHTDAIIGMIDELTKELPVDKPLRRAKAFSAIFCNGMAQNEHNKNGFDLVDLAVTAYPDFPVPESFEGMSGGALWRVFFTEQDNSVKIIAKRLIGVPFHQSTGADGGRIITCHGMKGIYTSLLDKIIAQWPDETG
jgi:hypothetical protein